VAVGSRRAKSQNAAHLEWLPFCGWLRSPAQCNPLPIDAHAKLWPGQCRVEMVFMLGVSFLLVVVWPAGAHSET